MKATKYTLLLTNCTNYSSPKTVTLTGGDDLKDVSARAEEILLAIAAINNLQEWVDDAIYAIDPQTNRANFVVTIRENASGEVVDPEL